MVTSADVEVYAELSRRLAQASTAVGAAAGACAGLLGAARWTGQAATAGRDREQRLAHALHTLSQRLAELADRSSRRRDHLMAHLARQRAVEAAILNDLGRLARTPADLEAHLGQEAETLRAAGKRLRQQLHHAVTYLVP